MNEKKYAKKEDQLKRRICASGCIFDGLAPDPHLSWFDAIDHWLKTGCIENVEIKAIK